MNLARRAVRLASLPLFVHRVRRDGLNRRVEQGFDAIVVPGARVREDGTPSNALIRRASLGVELFHAGVAPQLVFTGRGPGPTPEAEWMAEYASSKGVPMACIEQERHAMTTAENAVYTARLLQAQQIVVATDDTHVRRCVREFGRHYPVVLGVGGPTHGRVHLQNLLVEALKEAWREA